MSQFVISNLLLYLRLHFVTSSLSDWQQRFHFWLYDIILNYVPWNLGEILGKKEEMLKFHNYSLCLALMICARSGTKKEKLPIKLIGSFSKLYGSYWINKLVFCWWNARFRSCFLGGEYESWLYIEKKYYPTSKLKVFD